MHAQLQQEVPAVQDVLRQHVDLFATDDNDLGLHEETEHSFDLVPDALPYAREPYRYSNEGRGFIERQCQELLANESELNGATNLMASYGLEHSYNKFSGHEVKDQLSACLPNMPGNIDAPGGQDNSSLRSLIKKPPVCGKELLALTVAQLFGFRLHPGPLPEQYCMMSHQPQRNKHKHKKHKHKWVTLPIMKLEYASDASHENKHKQKRNDEEKERKKKEERKKEKETHSPEAS
ncbi:mediator of RNA polymerase II transcription subunit 19-like [Dermacentor silvarum]|uniref:mediator of RNA polymerase II transcription subunit 19-like n=1 Tax=Dermacentor silvarum TaxID=543639 RepID=UPI001897EC9E|nr:mediator of RNA polymerase II transcription subunit 19-like [Dermacentor silvarum]